MHKQFFERPAVEKPVIVTHRGYQEVCERLYLDPESLPEGSRVLSVGEGLSDFAQTLQFKRNVEAVKLDTIYEVIHPEDGLKMASAKFEVVSECAGKEVVPNWRLAIDEAKDLPPGKPATAVAASVYDIPSEIGQFDLITANRVLEHVHMGKALEGMLKALAPEGEIRLGLPFYIFPEADTRRIEFVIRYQGVFTRYDGAGAFEKTLKAHPELCIYAVVEKAQRALRGETVRPTDPYLAHALILRKDDRIPVVTNLIRGSNSFPDCSLHGVQVGSKGKCTISASPL